MKTLQPFEPTFRLQVTFRGLSGFWDFGLKWDFEGGLGAVRVLTVLTVVRVVKVLGVVRVLKGVWGL